MTELQRICILVADDDVLIRNLLIATLSRCGRLVLAAANAAETLELSGGFAGDIQLLITRDLEKARNIIQSRRETKVIILTDVTYSELREITRKLAPNSFREHAELPEQMNQCIERVLSQGRSGPRLTPA